MVNIQNIPTCELFTKGHRACAGCGAAIVMRHITKAAGENTIIAHATGCAEVFSTPYPESAWKLPWIHCLFENASAVASGIERALKKQNRKSNVLIIGGDGGTFDIGLQSLSGAAERGHDFCYICYDNGAYMNTGIQRSGATPKYSSTTTSPSGKKIHGKQENKKNMPFIMASHGAYVATANIAFVQDLISKVKKGIETPGPAFIQVFAPCPTGWHHAPANSIDIARLAFKANIYPMYEIENGILKLNRKPANSLPVKDYLQTQGRFKHMNESEINDVQNHVDSEMEKLENIDKADIRIF